MTATPDRLFLDFQTALAGRYSLERELGRGGMGIVYLARDLRLERVVAIKLLPPDRARATADRERFVREARTAAQLSHPNIIPIHAVEETGDFVFFVMSFVDGETLGARVRRDGPLKPQDGARILREVAWALAYAHGQGVVHRDVKPDNILLERAGRALVADFGIARLVQGPLPGKSGEGELVGTPEYMSPEQASGGSLDGRSDLYSLGVVGYYALSGRLPFTASSVAALLAQHVTKPYPPLTAPGAPRSLLAAVERCLEKDPARRPQSGEQLATVLGTALDTRRDLPVPLRAFLAEARSGGPRQMVRWMAAAWLVPAGLGFLLQQVFPGAVPSVFSQGVFAIAGILFGAALVAPGVFEMRRLRRLMRGGYTRSDLVHGLTLELERRREEQEYMALKGPTRFERLMRWKSYGAVAIAAICGAAAFVVPYPAIVVVFGLFGLSSAVAVATGVAAHSVSKQRLDVVEEQRLKLWQGPIGRWLFKLARIGFKRGAIASAAPAPERPTEVALGLAAVELFEALPKETRQQLGDLPAVVRGLEERVRRLRGDGRERQLGEALGALEVLRFDLLRLHGGIGTVAGLTADLGAARQIGEQVDALLEAHAELDEAL